MRFLAAAGLLALLCRPSLAFQEQTIGGVAGKPVAGISGLPGLDLSVPDPGIGKGTGTEIRIPGIGSLGVLPKIDLGLEMLYGPELPTARPDERADPSGLQLRATIKHRF
jgi:hypothetical protein